MLGGKLLIIRWWHKIAILFLLGLFLTALINSSWFLKFLYPFPHRDIVVRYCGEYKVDPYLTLAIIRTESRFHSKAYSRAGARGLMQIMPETGYWIAGQLKIDNYNEEMLNQPYYNIPMGIWYMSYLDKTFSANMPQMLAAYNAGESKVKKWLADKTWSGNIQDLDEIPYQETRDYVDKVIFDYKIYKRIYKKELAAYGF